MPVAAAGQVEATRKHVAWVIAAVPRVAIAVWPARIFPIAMVSAFPRLMPLIVTVAPVVMLLDSQRIRSAAERQWAIVVIAVTLIPIPRVARITCVTVIAQIEVEHGAPRSDYARWKKGQQLTVGLNRLTSGGRCS